MTLWFKLQKHLGLEMRTHCVLAALVGLGLRLFFVFRVPMQAGDTAMYEKLARNWLNTGVYGIFINGQLTPVDLRPPGYPAFLAALYAAFGRSEAAGHLTAMLAQAAFDVATCFLIAAMAASLAPPRQRRRAAIAALWLAATCLFVANYAAVPLTEVLATFLTALALLILLRGSAPRPAPEFETPQAATAIASPAASTWFLAGLVAGLGALLRPDAPLLLAAAGLVFSVRCRRPADWPKLARAGALMAAGLLLPLLPWAARNWRTLHRVQFLAPRYSELPGEFAPRGFYAWTRTWLVRLRDVYLVVWNLEDEPIRFEDFPPAAFDTPEERERVETLLEEYNEHLRIFPAADREFAQLARARTARHPLRTYLWVPLGRGAVMWFTPRTELLPITGHLWPPGQKWKEDPVDFSVTAGLGLLNFFYVGLAVAGACRSLRRPPRNDSQHRFGLALLVTFILVRTAFLTQIETPEPRYVLECFPAVLSLAALVCVRPRAWTMP